MNAQEAVMALREFRDALRGTRELELTVTGRNSGRESTRPVWFVQDDGNLFLLPVGGSDSNWYKNVLKTPSIELTAGGTELRANAQPLDDADAVRQVADRFRARYGADQVAGSYPKLDAAVAVPLQEG
jgi:deazaflavin-dependent oxidoreductase (nitroreductase family)